MPERTPDPAARQGPSLTFSKLARSWSGQCDPRSGGAAAAVCPALSRGDRADRQALDGRDRLRPDRGAAALRRAGKAVPGLSDRLLSQRLRELEEEGLVEREVEAGTPVRVTYSLTEKGAICARRSASSKRGRSRWKRTG